MSIYQLTRDMKSNATNVQSVVPNVTFQQLALLLCRGLS